MGGGAWPFLVRGLICLVNSDNERDLNLLISWDQSSDWLLSNFLERQLAFSQRKFEAITGL
jgi:hypothetical protein